MAFMWCFELFAAGDASQQKQEERWFCLLASVCPKVIKENGFGIFTVLINFQHFQF